jgi:hypothetical protein
LKFLMLIQVIKKGEGGGGGLLVAMATVEANNQFPPLSFKLKLIL